jgi:hypothetical protein
MKNKPANVVNDRPFSAAVLNKARKAVEEYRFAFWREDGRFVAQCVELDTLGVGATSAAALAEARSLAISAAAFLIESRKRLPLPAAVQARTVQVNIRLSPAEKRAIEDAARLGGFRGISDFMRIRALSLG